MDIRGAGGEHSQPNSDLIKEKARWYERKGGGGLQFSLLTETTNSRECEKVAVVVTQPLVLPGVAKH